MFGHAADEQTHLQAGSAGAIAGEPREGSDFGLGLALVLDGIRVRVPGASADVDDGAVLLGEAHRTR